MTSSYYNQFFATTNGQLHYQYQRESSSSPETQGYQDHYQSTLSQNLLQETPNPFTFSQTSSLNTSSYVNNSAHFEQSYDSTYYLKQPHYEHTTATTTISNPSLGAGWQARPFPLTRTQEARAQQLQYSPDNLLSPVPTTNPTPKSWNEPQYSEYTEPPIRPTTIKIEPVQQSSHQYGSTSTIHGTKVIACERCKSMKIKCEYQYLDRGKSLGRMECMRCLNMGQECVPGNGKHSRRISKSKSNCYHGDLERSSSELKIVQMRYS